MFLKKPNGEVRGRIDSQSDGSQRLYAKNGEYLGEYRASSDSTHSRNGSMVGRGNLLSVLLID